MIDIHFSSDAPGLPICKGAFVLVSVRDLLTYAEELAADAKDEVSAAVLRIAIRGVSDAIQSAVEYAEQNQNFKI